MKITLSAIKADIGSVGGHTTPHHEMVKVAQEQIAKAKKNKLILDGTITHTGDDLALIMSHEHGDTNPRIHDFAWDTFVKATKIAQKLGCYAAGQDLLADAPSGNVRGAGPGVAEITFDFTGKDPRAAESFMIFAADKTDPGAYNLPFFLSFADPMYCAGLMLPKLIKGFSFDIIDMSHADEDSIITLNAPEDYYKLSVLLRDNERFGIRAIHSRTFENQQALSVSTDRLHTIAGKYTGKDDPIAIVRTQGIFPAPEEIVSPFVKCHFVGGDARGSHNMPIMPVPINTAVTGFYCLPIVTAIGFSLNKEGHFSSHMVDFFDNPAWDFVRLKAQEKAIEMRSQGWSGPAMLGYSELEYSGFRDTIGDLEKKFKITKTKRHKIK